MIASNNLEVISFHYVCTNPNIIGQVNPRIFSKPEVRILFRVIKEFYIRFSVIPNLKSIDQMKEILTEDKEVQNFTPTKGVEDNIHDYLQLADIILSHPMDKYTPQWVQKVSEAFITVKNFETGAQTMLDWYDKQEATPDNVHHLVSQAQSMFLTNTSINLHEEQPISFWKGESHVQTKVTDLIPTGWDTMNIFLNGGFERKTLTHLWGAPNVGKSLFLGTIGRNVSLAGKNVFIGSLEMDPRKYIKRMGASLFNIPVGEYSSHEEPVFFYEKLKAYREDPYNTIPPGAFYIQRFSHASPKTITLAADKLAKELGLAWDLVIYDYLGELESSNNMGMDQMYALHKTNNAELFDHSVIYNWASLTAHQVTPDFFDAQDMSMKASAESRGISHRTDNIFGIIQDPLMFSAGKFFLKNLKARDNEYKNHYMRLSIDWKYMALTDDSFMVKPNDNLMI